MSAKIKRDCQMDWWLKLLRLDGQRAERRGGCVNDLRGVYVHLSCCLLSTVCVCVCVSLCVWCFCSFLRKTKNGWNVPLSHTHVCLTIVVRTLVKIMIPQALTSAHHNRMPKHISNLYYKTTSAPSNISLKMCLKVITVQNVLSLKFSLSS